MKMIVGFTEFIKENKSFDKEEIKEKIIDDLIIAFGDDFRNGDTTVINEVLLSLPYKLLVHSIIEEERWKDYENEKDKQKIVDAIILQTEKEYYNGDTTVIAELLKFLEIEQLIAALPDSKMQKYQMYL